MTEKLKTRKVNVGLALSQNYDKVTFEIIDEPITYNEDIEDEFTMEVRKLFSAVREMVKEQFDLIDETRKAAAVKGPK